MDFNTSTTGTSVSDKMAHLVREVQDAETELNKFTTQVGGNLPSDKQRAEELLVDPSFRAYTAENAHTAASKSITETLSEEVRHDAVEGYKADRERAKREKRDKTYADVTELLHNNAAQAAVKLAKENREERDIKGGLSDVGGGDAVRRAKSVAEAAGSGSMGEEIKELADESRSRDASAARGVAELPDAGRGAVEEMRAAAKDGAASLAQEVGGVLGDRGASTRQLLGAVPS